MLQVGHEERVVISVVTKRAGNWLASPKPTNAALPLWWATDIIAMSRESLLNGSKDRRVSLATVYNTLRAFCYAGLLQEVTVDGSRSYFDTNTHDHPHLLKILNPLMRQWIS